ncbi:MAG: membrane protein of unknown function [Promethearchaeota archaeon]|nr:MAG: membrane protein of unknown function [Candidatus Lokiarchaeota archaeon]
MSENKNLEILINIIIVAAGILIFIGALLPIAEGVIDFGIFKINLSGSVDISLAKSTISFNFLLNRISVEFFAIDLFALLGLYDIILSDLFPNLISSPILTFIPVLILIIGIFIALLGVLRLLHDFKILEGGDAILRNDSMVMTILFIIAAGAVIVLPIIEFVIVSTQVVDGAKMLHELFGILLFNEIFPELTTSATPLGGFYLTLISAIGLLVMFIILLTIATKAEGQSKAKTISS